MNQLLSAGWAFLSCTSMGMYPRLRLRYSPSVVIVNEEYATAIVIDWEMPKTVFESHWAAPWNRMEWDIPISF